MFKQLSPLLSTRSLILTVALVADQRIRVTVSPRSNGKEDPKELAQPFVVEGTAEELDNELSQAIVNYTAEHMTLSRSLEQVKTNMAAALEDAKAEANKKIAEAKKNSKTNSPAKAEPQKLEVKKPTVAGLFDVPSNEPVPGNASNAASLALLTSAATASLAAATPQASMFDTANEEDEILKEAFYGTEDKRIAA